MDLVSNQQTRQCLIETLDEIFLIQVLPSDLQTKILLSCSDALVSSSQLSNQPKSPFESHFLSPCNQLEQIEQMFRGDLSLLASPATVAASENLANDLEDGEIAPELQLPESSGQDPLDYPSSSSTSEGEIFTNFCRVASLKRMVENMPLDDELEFEDDQGHGNGFAPSPKVQKVNCDVPEGVQLDCNPPEDDQTNSGLMPQLPSPPPLPEQPLAPQPKPTDYRQQAVPQMRRSRPLVVNSKPNEYRRGGIGGGNRNRNAFQGKPRAQAQTTAAAVDGGSRSPSVFSGSSHSTASSANSRNAGFPVYNRFPAYTEAYRQWQVSVAPKFILKSRDEKTLVFLEGFSHRQYIGENPLTFCNQMI